MRKEIVWAGIIGVSFGLIITFGTYRINSFFNKSKAISTEATPSPKDNQEFKITLDKPENDDVVTQNSVTVSGITKPLIWITVSGEDDDYILQAGDNGVFTQNVNLIPGVNQIKITAFDPEGNESIEKVLVIYSSSFQLKTTETDTATGDADIRQKVEAKVEAAMNKPKAYIGIVTDITDSTIQIKTNEIKQVSANDKDTTVVKTGATNKIVKLSDIAIGDFIVAMGYINTSSVLSAQRILITDPVTEPKIASTMGKVTEISKKTLTVADIKDKQSEVVTPGSKIKFANIKVEDVVIYVIDSSSDTPKVRTIFLIPHNT